MWNLAGQAVPLVVALACIPILLNEMGTARFGLLTLLWVLVGYVSLFDLGLGRALTLLVARMLPTESASRVPDLVWGYVALTAVAGAAAGLGLALGADAIATRVLKVGPDLEPEARDALRVLAVAVPAVMITAGLRGVLEARQRFALATAIRLPVGILTFVGPLAVVPFSHSLFAMAVVLTAVRLVALGAHCLACAHVDPSLRRPTRPRWHVLRPLLALSGWMTVGNLVAPLTAYLDRFVIGGVASLAAVTYYATPHDLVTRLSVVPLAVAGVLFPAFSTSFTTDPGRARQLYAQGTRWILFLMVPPVLAVIAFAEDGLSVWLGDEFARQSALVLQLLSVAVLVNSLAQVPFGLIQGVGRPDLTAKLHLIELPIYVAGIWLLVDAMGIEGAALAWLIRVAVDTVALFWIGGRLLGMRPRIPKAGSLAAACSVAAAAAILVVLPGSALLKGGALALALSLAMTLIWRQVFSRDDRLRVRSGLRLAMQRLS